MDEPAKAAIALRTDARGRTTARNLAIETRIDAVRRNEPPSCPEIEDLCHAVLRLMIRRRMH